MSESTTGAVALSVIGAPLAVGAACLGAVYFAGKYCVQQYGKLLKDIEKTDKRLDWLNKQVISSPKQMEQEAKRLQNMVSGTAAFQKMTANLSQAQKIILSGVIATQKSPLKAYVPKLLEGMPENVNVFEQALDKGVKQLAIDNFSFVNNIVKEAAKATGFDAEVKILKNTNSTLDIVFSDKDNKKFTAFCKLDKELNPSLALDLEGFSCDDKMCTQKMDEIVKYLREHGVPFEYTRLKHNQPMGILRKILNKKNAEKQKTGIQDYLQGNSADSLKSTKH